MTPGIRRLLGLASLVAAATAATVSRPPLLAQTDLDALMSTVLTKRDDNWKKLQQYTLDERAARGGSRDPPDDGCGAKRASTPGSFGRGSSFEVPRRSTV